ncbi:MAG: ergothioneine biosynthesis protein EgtB [Leptospiraceae bacterium]|nr:ergothioneine biosynthesis protein EgtB [Leptospiraceae bacterium]
MHEIYTKIRNRTEYLVNSLEPEDTVPQPMTDVSPTKWHLAHTTWFFETFILIPFSKSYKIFNENYNYLFNSYYQSKGDRVRRDFRGFHSRPTMKEVLNYRKYIDENIIKLLYSNTDKEEIERRVTLGIHHEEQHQELLLTDLKYTWSFSPFYPIFSNAIQSWNKEQFQKKWLKVNEGLYEIGNSSKEFHFDNESPKHKIFLNEFKIQSLPVTNGEYLEFIEENGYDTWEFWLSDGWAWVSENQISSPLYWKKIDGKWYEYTLNGLIELNKDLPLTHISFYEADAFARYQKSRLPTEGEWEVACCLFGPERKKYGFLEDSNYHPKIFDKDILFRGNVWQWTNSAYLPYPGFKPWEKGLGEYNGKFMINQMVLRGGSCVTPFHHIRNTYRNFFYPHQRWQFTGIRLAKD